MSYFVEVAERGNISEAARVLNITQPALSRQVRSFEDEMGWELLVRGGKSVALTRAGKTVMREGRRILKAVEAGESRMRREVEGAELRIGFAPSLASGIIEKAMAVFCQLHPTVKVHLHDSTTEEMWQGLRQGSLDLILEVATREAEIRWEVLKQKNFRIAVPAGHRFEKKRKIKAGDLEGERLILLSRTDYPGYWAQVTDYFSTHGLNAKVAGEFDGISSLRMGLQAGMGLAFVADGSALPKPIRVIKLDPEPEPLCVGVGWLATRTLAAWEEVFVEELKRAARKES
ncbi:MAG: LysR family transcriptional regulator [Roseibacillus sp.]